MKPLALTRAAELEFAELPGRQSANPLRGVELGELAVRIVRLRPGPRAPHRHPSCVEVISVLEGEGAIWIEGEATRLAPGDVVAVPAGAAHCTIPDAGMLLHCAFPVADVAANTVELDEPVELSGNRLRRRLAP